MEFGLYIGSVAGTDKGLTISKPDIPSKIVEAIEGLQSADHLLKLRMYMYYLGNGELELGQPDDFNYYLGKNRKLNLVLCYRSKTYSEKDWLDTISRVIHLYRDDLYELQITEEPNLKNIYSGDGFFPNVERALLVGVLEAKRIISELKLNIKLGFNAVPSFDVKDPFWSLIGSPEYVDFRMAIDYVGLDFFPDVFRPILSDDNIEPIRQAVKDVLTYFRKNILYPCGISQEVPIHITENGWPTGEKRSEERQALVLETIISTIIEVRRSLNIDSYTLFSLRDSDSSSKDLFYQFGILKDDYTPKLAYSAYRDLIKKHGQ